MIGVSQTTACTGWDVDHDGDSSQSGGGVNNDSNCAAQTSTSPEPMPNDKHIKTRMQPPKDALPQKVQSLHVSLFKFSSHC